LDKSLSNFSESEQLALEYAVLLVADHHNMDDGYFDRLKTQYS